MSGIEFFTSGCNCDQVTKDSRGCSCEKIEHRFRIRASNGEILAQSEGYTTLASARKGAESAIANLVSKEVAATILRGFLNEELREMTTLLPRYPEFEPIVVYLQTRIEVLDRGGITYRERESQ